MDITSFLGLCIQTSFLTEMHHSYLLKTSISNSALFHKVTSQIKISECEAVKSSFPSGENFTVCTTSLWPVKS